VTRDVINSIVLRLEDAEGNPHVFCDDLLALWEHLDQQQRNNLIVALMHMVDKVVAL
jgi:uncharacterized tellurite resistance protein B-like protein